MFVYLNKVADQLYATITIYLSSISSTCFGQYFAHPQERKIVIYSMWYNVPRSLSVRGMECGRTDCEFGVKEVARLVSSIGAWEGSMASWNSGFVNYLFVML